MLWALATALGLVVTTGLVFVLARPITARWEQEQRPPVTVDE